MLDPFSRVAHDPCLPPPREPKKAKKGKPAALAAPAKPGVGCSATVCAASGCLRLQVLSK